LLDAGDPTAVLTTADLLYSPFRLFPEFPIAIFHKGQDLESTKSTNNGCPRILDFLQDSFILYFMPVYPGALGAHVFLFTVHTLPD